jgi:putative zinc finger protein
VRGHVSAETMADFRAGLLPGRQAAEISAHLSSCPRCAELDAQLASVISLLAATPVPLMPAALVARLDAALATEVAARAGRTDTAVAAGTDTARAASAPPGPTPPPATELPPGHRRPAGARRGGRGPGRGRTRPRSRLALRLTTAAAAIVLAAGGGYAIAQLVSGGTPATTAGPTVGTPHSVAGQSAASRSAASGLAPAAQPAARLPVVHSGTRYQTSLLPAQVRSVLRRFAAAVPAPSGHVPRPAAASAAFPQLAACMSRVTGGAVPRLIDIASYGGRPVAVIVVPVPGSSTVRVWLVGTACPAHGGDVIAHFRMPGTG